MAFVKESGIQHITNLVEAAELKEDYIVLRDIPIEKLKPQKKTALPLGDTVEAKKTIFKQEKGNDCHQIICVSY